MSNKTVALQKWLNSFSKATLVKVLASLAAEPVCMVTDKLLFKWLELLDLAVKMESVKQGIAQTAQKLESLNGKNRPQARRQVVYLFKKLKRLQERRETLIKAVKDSGMQDGGMCDRQDAAAATK